MTTHMLSPSDNYEETCEICEGEGQVRIEDDRYGEPSP